MLGHILTGGTPGNGVAEKRATATEQAVEAPGGGRNRPRTMNAPCHRRAASRSGGATSAERDGRPVHRRNGHSSAAAGRGSPKRAWRMPGAAEEVSLRVEPMSDRRAPGTAPVGPDRNPLPWRPFSPSTGPENHVPRSARHTLHRRSCRRRLTPGPRGAGAGHPPAAIRRRQTESSSAVPGSRTRDTENLLEAPTGELRQSHRAGRRAGAEARQAPNATEGRCFGNTNPDAAAGSESLRTHDSCARHLFRHLFPFFRARFEAPKPPRRLGRVEAKKVAVISGSRPSRERTQRSCLRAAWLVG
jgi:hypothetical protein